MLQAEIQGHQSCGGVPGQSQFQQRGLQHQLIHNNCREPAPLTKGM
jgi:hypothetical protein